MGSLRFYRHRPSVIALEDRFAPAVAITAFDVAAGTITFTGDQGGSVDDTLVLSTTVVNGQTALSHNLVGNGTGNFADATDIDPSAAVARLVIGSGASPLVTVNLATGGDNLTLGANWNLALRINANGGTGTDTLTGTNVAATWAISGAGAGTINGTAVTFTELEVLQGGTGNDTFNLSADFAGTIRGGAGNNTFRFAADGVVLTGTIAGEAGTDVLSYAGYTSPVTINLQTDTATGLSGFTGIESVVGGSGSDTLIGANVANLWMITGTNAGSVKNDSETIQFSAIENLTGGTARDDFFFAALGKLSGGVTGGGGIDVLNFAGHSDPIIFRVTADDAGSVTVSGTTMTFAEIEHLVGGRGNDVFSFLPDANLSGRVNGLLGSDTLVYASFTEDITVDLNTGQAPNIGGGIASIENIFAGSGDDTLIGNGGGNVLVGNAGDDILLGNAGFDILVGGAGRDLLIGGNGLDFVFGGTGEDIIIAGRTRFDADLATLNRVRAQWQRTDLRYQQRINSMYQFVRRSIVDDSSRDVLFGGDDALDWFLYSHGDVIADKNSPTGERKTQVH